MDYQKFEERYNNHRRGLEALLAMLKERIEQGVEMLKEKRKRENLPNELFRIRLKEARIKDCKSLYQKIAGDSELKFDQAFEPGHVRDLLGARIICNNISDVEQIAALLRKGEFQGLHSIEAKSGPKDWLRNGHPESGYRGVHYDVRWPSPGSPNRHEFAELQIRTVLQDAWATLMHDDIYKHRADLGLSTHLLAQAKEMSDLLYWADQWAGRVRTSIENAEIAPGLKISLLEGLVNHMFAMVNFTKDGPPRLPHYATIKRHDRYMVHEKEPVFRFSFIGDLRQPKPFVFPIAGDTPHENFKLLSFRSEDRENLPEAVEKRSTNTVVLHDKRARRRHSYEIECIWKEVFDREHEYLWCPWRTLYPGADVNYKLEVVFTRRPAQPPRLYVCDDQVATYRGFWHDYGNAGGSRGVIGKEGTERIENGNYVYSFEPSETSADFLCLFTTRYAN